MKKRLVILGVAGIPLTLLFVVGVVGVVLFCAGVIRFPRPMFCNDYFTAEHPPWPMWWEVLPCIDGHGQWAWEDYDDNLLVVQATGTAEQSRSHPMYAGVRQSRFRLGSGWDKPGDQFVTVPRTQDALIVILPDGRVGQFHLSPGLAKQFHQECVGHRRGNLLRDAGRLLEPAEQARFEEFLKGYQEPNEAPEGLKGTGRHPGCGQWSDGRVAWRFQPTIPAMGLGWQIVGRDSLYIGNPAQPSNHPTIQPANRPTKLQSSRPSDHCPHRHQPWATDLWHGWRGCQDRVWAGQAALTARKAVRGLPTSPRASLDAWTGGSGACLEAEGPVQVSNPADEPCRLATRAVGPIAFGGGLAR